MKTMIDRHITERLRELTDRYYDGTASLAEERELLETLRRHSGNLPADLEEEHRVLKGIDPAAADSDVAQFCESVIDTFAAPRQAVRPLRRLVVTLLSAAAAVALMIGIAVGVMKDTSRIERPLTAKTEPTQTLAPEPAALTQDTAVMIAKSEPAEAQCGAAECPRLTQRVAAIAQDTVRTVREHIAREITDSAEAVSRIEATLTLLADKFDRAAKGAEISGEAIENTKEIIKTYLRYEETI